MFEALATNSRRDPRIDVIRGLALLMIFVDHMPSDVLNQVTMHNFGFCDAAEVFVMLAGMSSMLAYGKAFCRDGMKPGLRRIALRCGRIYLFQVGLLLITCAVVIGWSRIYGLTPTIIAPILGAPVKGLAHGLTLSALPQYLDILPLYIVLLGIFPLIFLALRRSIVLGVSASAMVWFLSNLFPGVDLPNWIDGKGWYFNPFAWQFLFTLGAVLALMVRSGERELLPQWPALRLLTGGFLAFACLQSFPWHDWHLPTLSLFPMSAPDKSHEAPLRLLDISALMYLLLSSPLVARLCRSALLRPIEACGRHSLEVFSLSCILALFGRLAFRTHGSGFPNQVLVNGLGFLLMALLALLLEHVKAPPRRAPAPAPQRTLAKRYPGAGV
jgi:hypothetical protein